MRKFLFLVLPLSILSATAATLDVTRLPAPSYADREVSGDTALPAGRTEGLRVFRLELTFESTPSNNVQVAFGRDTRPADSSLAAEEIDFIIGWDCGEWFLRPHGLKVRHTFTPAAAGGRRTLTAAIRVNPQGVPQPSVFKDGSAAFTFDGLALSPFPEWLNPSLWTHLRVTVRGADAAAENVSASFLPGGARITVK